MQLFKEFREFVVKYEQDREQLSGEDGWASFLLDDYFIHMGKLAHVINDIQNLDYAQRDRIDAYTNGVTLAMITGLVRTLDIVTGYLVNHNPSLSIDVACDELRKAFEVVEFLNEDTFKKDEDDRPYMINETIEGSVADWRERWKPTPLPNLVPKEE